MKPPRFQPVRCWGQGLVFALLLGLAAGCATFPHGQRDETRRALHSIPEVPGGQRRADRAIIAAFFAASGAPLVCAELDEILPLSAPSGHLDRNAIRRIATKKNRVAMVVKADERFLWDDLGQNLPLLIFLPPDVRYSPSPTPLIPIAWDQGKKTLDLLDGNGEIRTMGESDFFTRRAPLKQAALCLIKPGKFPHFEPTREQKLLLADFWFDQGFYRRAHAAYSALQESTSTPDVDALMGQGNILVRKGRYQDAIPVYRAALVLEPDNSKILNNLAYAMLNGNGELLIALRHATKANHLDPGNPLVLETLGSLNLRIGDASAAAEYLEQAWARSLKRSSEVQIAIMDQLVRAWLAADRRDLAWQVAEYRHRTFPTYQVPKDILLSFPILRRPPTPIPGKN